MRNFYSYFVEKNLLFKLAKIVIHKYLWLHCRKSNSKMRPWVIRATRRDQISGYVPGTFSGLTVIKILNYRNFGNSILSNFGSVSYLRFKIRKYYF